MASFAFAKVLNTNDRADDAFAVSGLWPLSSASIGYAFEQPTSLGGGLNSQRIYSNIFTISGSTITTERDVSGSGTNGFSSPSFCGNVDNTVQLCSYSAGHWITPYVGFVVKETSDNQVTWGNSYSGGGSYNNDSNRGLFRDTQTGDVYLITQSLNVGGYKVNVHKRTGAGTWSVVTAYTGTSTNYYLLDQTPQQNAVFVNGKGLIVGPKTNGSIYALRTTDGVTWTEVLIKSYSDGAQRMCKLVRTSDGIIRVMVQGQVGESFPAFKRAAPSMYLSNDLGATWVALGIPPGLGMEDQNGNPVGWPNQDLTALTLDGRGRMFITLGDNDRAYLQTFRAWSTAYNSWGHLATDTISDGSGNTYNSGDLSQLPSSSVAVGSDIFRVVCAWISGSNCARAWMLKFAGGSLAPGGHTGGGGQPRTYSAGD